ncbi:ATP-dependent DNA helicase UvrD2 [Nigerium massiliense]|uniref:ATP-dependent DNA helicase UvrD2 n=1 Tax=Nigerium massiliense TaxID=1522317 RepID=UPI00058C5D9D|nr:ATP-dependent DNA helicase UvrD2 [Nigerium massiliense]
MVADPDSILAALDPEQAQAATSLEGPVVVLAGAGTGKTRAMTHRIAYGVAIGAFDPHAVLALTFTTRAAGEMRGRLRRLGVAGVQARTFHSAALRQLQYFWPRAYGSPLPPLTDNRAGLVAEAVRRQGLVPDAGLLRDLGGEISWAKVSNVTPDDYPAAAQSRGRTVAGHDPEEIARLLTRYEQAKLDRAQLDFDDVLLCTAGMLADHADVAHEVRRTYRHFVVDEYQDVSPLQQALLDLWRGDSDDLCVVGDPAQTIHSFAGAQARFLLEFTARHPRATRIELVRDYRSTPPVVELANRLMTGHGAGVTLRSARQDGPAPEFAGAASEFDEADGIASWIAGLLSAGVAPAEIAVLYRIHAQSPAIEAALTQAGIPFVTRGSEGFFDRAEVRTALRSLANASDSGEPVNVQLAAVLAGLGWTTEPPEGQGSLRERWESWSALASLGDRMAAARPDAALADLVEELQVRRATQQAPLGEGVTLATLHAAKGLEWDAVAIAGVHEGSLPFALATTPDEIDEERRLLYVGVTRARTHLRVSWSASRDGRGQRRARSRFLDGLIAAPGPARAVPARRRNTVRTVLSSSCRSCGRGLSTGAELKLGRHLDCPSSYSPQLWDALQAWRADAASEQSLPPFVVFTDATLMAIAEQLPPDLASLGRIPGVGPRKLERYGADVLQILDAHR